MSEPGGPVRRRRIAGESGPTPAARKTSRVPAARPATPRKPATARKTSAPPAAPPPLDTGATTPAAPAKAPRGGIPRGEWRWLAPTAIAAILVLVLGAGLAARGWSEVRGGSGGVAASQRQAAVAAGTAAETIFSFRYDQLDQHLDESKALMTEGFAGDFDKIAPALTELAPQRKVIVQAVTRHAAALGCGDDCSSTKAKILVFVDQARLVGGTDEPTVFGNRITVSMVKQDGTWLVSDIRAL